MSTNNLTDNAIEVLKRRYLAKDKKGKIIESPLDMFKRVAWCMASVDSNYNADLKGVENLYNKFLNTMTSLEFIPNSPTLMNAGRPIGQLAACFVLPVYDDMEQIFETQKQAALIHQSGGGTGFDFSNLREKGSIVNSTSGVASGPVSFMKVYDSATNAIKQGGTRRGANMGMLRIDHPDILEFIECKDKDGDICNFNISVSITDKFMKALKYSKDYELVSPKNNKVVGKLNSKEVFQLIIDSAHKNGEPGLIFIDEMNRGNPTPEVGLYSATNPCGEQVLLPYESCNLGSINLLKMLKKSNHGYEIDYAKLDEIVSLSIHFLDNVIDANKHPIKQIETSTKYTRKVGLGVMGWASMLVRMGIVYGSEESFLLADKVMSSIQKSAEKKSLELGKTKGVFPAFEKSVFKNKGSKFRFRNATLTTIAPTGTISIIGGPCSSGIEPIFSITYYRNVMDKTKLIEVEKVFEDVAKERGFYSDELMKRIAEEGGIQNIDEIPNDVKKVFVTSHDINPEQHIKMQAVFQKSTDNAVSKTINFSESTTKEEVKTAYELAYKLKCKGVTVYRDGSRSDQVLNVGSQKSENGRLGSFVKPKVRPNEMRGVTKKVNTGCGDMYVTMNHEPNKMPFELFAQMGKAGGCASAQLETISRLISLCYRSNVDENEIKEQLKGIRCPAPAYDNGQKVLSCADAIYKAIDSKNNGKHELTNGNGDIKQNLPEMNNIKVQVKKEKNMVGMCPECNGILVHEEGCSKCYGCGFTRC